MGSSADGREIGCAKKLSDFQKGVAMTQNSQSIKSIVADSLHVAFHSLYLLNDQDLKELTQQLHQQGLIIGDIRRIEEIVRSQLPESINEGAPS